MQALLIAVVIVVPTVMFLLRGRAIAVLFDLLAAVAMWLAALSVGLVVLQMKLDHTEMTMQVHQIFLDPIFLISGGYIGLYAIYRLLVTSAGTLARFTDTVEDDVQTQTKKRAPL